MQFINNVVYFILFYFFQNFKRYLWRWRSHVGRGGYNCRRRRRGRHWRERPGTRRRRRWRRRRAGGAGGRWGRLGFRRGKGNGRSRGWRRPRRQPRSSLTCLRGHLSWIQVGRIGSGRVVLGPMEGERVGGGRLDPCPKLGLLLGRDRA